MSLSTGQTLREILRFRPRAIDVLQEASRSRFWQALDRTLEEFCRDSGWDPASLASRIEALPFDARDRDWTKAPLYHLVDRLTRDHHEFREQDLAGIERLLSAGDPTVFPEDYPWESIKREFHSFKIDFYLHMEEEEAFLFPKVLKTEASLFHPEMTPESFKGSVSVYSGTMLHTPEFELKEMVSHLRRKTGRGGAEVRSFPLLGIIDGLMVDLEAKLAHHAKLETEVLLPRTLEMEADLNRRNHPEASLYGDS